MSVQELRLGLAAKLRGHDLINDPYLGEVAATAFEANSPLWPGESWASVEPLFLTEADGRRLGEYRFMPADGHKAVLPVAVMSEVLPDGRSRAILYSDHHLVEDRAPVHAKRADIHPWRSEQDVLFSYFRALAACNVEDAVALFEDDGYVRHSNGETFEGRAALRQDFTKMMGSTGIRLQYSRFTDDGTTCAAEVYMPSGRPAVSVYQRGNAGRLKAVRIYL